MKIGAVKAARGVSSELQVHTQAGAVRNPPGPVQWPRGPSADQNRISQTDEPLQVQTSREAAFITDGFHSGKISFYCGVKKLQEFSFWMSRNTKPSLSLDFISKRFR